MIKAETLWENGRPRFIDIKRMWNSLKCIDSLVEQPDIGNLLNEFRKIYSKGGATLHCFEVERNKIFDWFLERPLVEEGDFFDTLLTSDAVISAAQELKIQPKMKICESFDKNPGFKWLSPFILDGLLTHALLIGGAYNKFGESGAEAKRICQKFCEAIFEDRYFDIRVYYSHSAWSKWFCDVAWDNTWIIIDSRKLRIWLLCLTDTD